MFTKLTALKRSVIFRLGAPVMVLALGISSVAGFVAPAQTHAYAYPDYSIMNCAQERHPLITLSQNYQHRCVVALQHFYKYFQGYNLTIDGYYGNQSAFWTVVYQNSTGLGADGEVGNQTWGQILFQCLDAYTAQNAYKILVCNQTH